MSSDEEPIHTVQEISDNEQNNEIMEIDENLQDQEEQTEEVQRDNAADGEGTEVNDTVPVKPKRIIRNPRPKLNAETLKGPKGIAALESYFERVKFKGKGKEQQDLEVVMKTYEYWCHRLFPKFPFDSCIEKLEILGNKKPVQTHIKRIRFDLLIEDKPILNSSDEEPNVEGFVDIQNDEISQQQNQLFDQLLRPTTDSTPVVLTEEQLERIRLNKERAERLKQERLSKIRGKAEESLQGSSQLPGTSGLECEREIVQSEAANSTQSDIFSQEGHTPSLEIRENTLNDLNEIEETLFDHESNVKGKGHIKGTIIKKANKLNKRTAIFNGDSGTSDNNMKGNYQNEYVPSKGESGELSDGVENSSDSDDEENQKHKKISISKRTTLSSDNDLEDENSSDSDDEVNRKQKDISISKRTTLSSDDDLEDENFSDSDDGENQKQKEISISKRTRLSSDDDLDDEIYTKRNILQKKQTKHVLMDTDESSDESDQDKELNQSSKDLNVSKTKKKLNDLGYNNSDQELSNINKANSLGGLVENSSDLNYMKSKRNIIYDSNDDQSSDEENQKHKEISISKSTKLSSDDSEDENHTKRNISHKKQAKHSVLMDTDESDQEKELNNQSSKEIIATDTRENSNDLDVNTRDQQLSDVTKTNSFEGFVENSSDFNFSTTNIKAGNGAVPKLAETDERLNNNGDHICKINNDLSINGVNEHSLKPKSQLPNTVAVVELDERLNSDEPMEIIEKELEAVLKSNQDTHFINS